MSSVFVMKRFFLIIYLFLSLAGAAQQYNNEWIDYSKTYYKFNIASNGLYRIYGATLAAANLGSTDASRFQLWRNGTEVPIYVSKETGTLGADDYIEFWGQMNDGKADNALYRTPDQQLSDSKSLFSDSAAYFLTVNPSGVNKRLVSTANNIPAGVAPEPYFMYTSVVDFNEQLHYGPSQGTGTGTLYTSSFEGGKGWASTEISSGAGRSVALTLYPYSGAGAPDMNIQMNVVGSNAATRRAQLSVNNSIVFDSVLSGFNYLKLSKALPASMLNGATENFRVINQPQGTDPSRMRVAVIRTRYARKFNFGGAGSFQFTLPARSTGYYLEITNFSYSGGAPVLYDLNNGRRYLADISTPSVVKLFLPATGNEQQLVLSGQATGNIKQVTSLIPRNFVNYAAANNQGNYLIITDRSLLNGSNGTTPVQDYQNYRSSPEGGSYNARTYLMDQLTDQFAYGTRYSILSVRNFLRFARAKFTVPPKAAFLIGKGVNYIASWASPAGLQTGLAQLNLVPTFGYPGSDVLLSAEGSSSQPLTPIGRLSVISGDELTDYLQKIKEYEQALKNTPPGIEESEWKKSVIHVVGASDDATIGLLAGLLQQHRAIIEDTLYGAQVESFVKNDNTSNQATLADLLANRINSGAALLTYFGHSSSSTLSFNLENPSNYSNQGKYPVFNMMGCSAGDIFGYETSRVSAITTISEKYVLAKNRGSIGLLAGTSIGYVSTLDFYNTKFYTLLSGNDYGKPVGDLMLNTIKEVYRIKGENDFLQRAQCEEYLINGDPAIRLYQFARPDYAIEDASVNVNPAFISIAESKFTIAIKINNLGKAVNQKVIIELKRTYPDQSVAVFKRDTLSPIRFADSLVYTVPIDPVKDKGQNKISISIDPENLISELNETNNKLVKDIYIYEDEIRPVYPYDYAIVNQTGLKLEASTANPLATSRTYLMEMDTTALFNSPLKTAQTQTSTGGVLEFVPGGGLRNNTVYYWRVASKPENNEQPRWNSSSFIYLPGGQTGFNQSHYYQQLKWNLSQLEFKESDRLLHFDSTITGITVTHGFFPNVSAASDMQLRINDIPAQGWMLSPFSGSNNVNTYTLRFYVIDNRRMRTWDNADLGTSGRFGSVRPVPAQSNTIPTFFQFKVQTPQQRKNVMDFMDSIPKGFYVIVANSAMLPNVAPSEWLADEAVYGAGNTLYHKLLKEGVSVLNEIKTNLPFILFLQKGSGKPLKELVGSTQNDKLNETIDVKAPLRTGSFETPVLGPARSWNKFIWEGQALEANSNDQLSFDVYGIGNSGAATLLKTVKGLVANKEADLSDINAAQYPQLKIRASVADTVNLTPYQLSYLRLYYTPVPEGAIAPNLNLSAKDTLEIGEPLNFSVAFKNVSNYNFDSIKVSLSVRDRNNVETVIPVPSQKALVAGDTIKLSVPLATRKYAGNNTLLVNFNPDNAQPEQYLFNNFLYKSFYVKGDTTNPYMDVTFDGIHILNSDIVSSKPDVLIKLSDNARYLLLNDPDLIRVQLRFPDGSIKTYAAGTDTLVFTPAGQNGSNTATMNFKPQLSDGNYELMVAAKDESGNTAGNIQYKIAFQVISKPMISNMLNYPNPFTTSTAFVFTLTGSEVPQNIRIQILTITGKIVREITKAELGPLHIGRNITEFKWDGTDQYGQKLANGVYLYRVITNLNGKSLDKYKAAEDNTDKYFNKGYGKMYLMR
ncbi:hypothetical protein A8C56_06570 [Niabella ginsenosidivorans]|uniref:Gingipain domain-containing protein n=1 Tax=Niabella ginsenosidivorans TaxID=1176587 RepID=A0A1A9HZ54_9BACT|nr:C25 family cysteine peptidase [Niabella ginsenosidivorans]ANH80687.1 hypothetical protein A8C56_06570 [Niabella ginsenosidivorans]